MSNYVWKWKSIAIGSWVFRQRAGVENVRNLFFAPVWHGDEEEEEEELKKNFGISKLKNYLWRSDEESA
jgi:hypothetical protein